jgi:hypothetical protein
VDELRSAAITLPRSIATSAPDNGGLRVGTGLPVSFHLAAVEAHGRIVAEWARLSMSDITAESCRGASATSHHRKLPPCPW